MKIVCLFLTMFSFTVNAQFKTQYNNLGEPISEIIDPLMMKQGKWTYYNNKNQIIRQENYINNELIDRKYFSDDVELKIQQINEFQSLTFSTNKLPGTIHGEGIIDDKGKIIEISYYFNQDAKLIKQHKRHIKSYLKSIAKDYKKTIIIF